MRDKYIGMLDKATVVLFDVDGTLCEGMAWTPEDCLKLKPKQKIVDRLNELAKTKFIVIYTSRRDHLIPTTMEWLRRKRY